ncbi:hypothetical protein SAMN06265795_105203 [Noviherbaspirillum humi]|uniref:Uncharacterized protein n=1 Tax=Noviherbaspirillum humi TaxID=1688639 RepID=A0A239GV70_9BURK|nr:hypothetical protein [Noviherbaspirillum humi]SNS72871.1 hypothetical protein SAMN06265795_105203 [Noviherbaspirillum humi]
MSTVVGSGGQQSFSEIKPAAYGFIKVDFMSRSFRPGALPEGRMSSSGSRPGIPFSVADNIGRSSRGNTMQRADTVVVAFLVVLVLAALLGIFVVPH